MRFKVTGGADGVSGIEFQGKRYEPGAEVDMTAKQAEWLVEQGYLESPDAAAKRVAVVEPAVEPVIADEPAPATDDSVEGEV